MNDLRKAAQRALKAMEDGEDRADMIEFSDALVALRQALAEPEQELGQALKHAIERINELEALNAELVGALKHAAECVQTNYLPDKCGHDWDDVIQRAEASK